MTDLVDRLRASVKACRALDRSQLLEEAAGEIQRLRAELVECRRMVGIVNAVATIRGSQTAQRR